MAWLIKAYENGNLRITTDRMCPYCNPEKSEDEEVSLNACEKHKWVNKDWFIYWYKEKFDEYPDI